MESAQAQQPANPATGQPSAAEDGRSLDMIRTLFPTGEIFAVSDDGELGREASRCGLVFVALDQVTQVPDGANVIVLLRRNLVTVQIRKAFRRHRALVVPIASFDTGSLPALYTLQMLLRTDYAEAARRSRDWAAQLAGNRDPLVFRSREDAGDEPRTHLTCTLADRLTADAWLTPEIQPGQWVSVGAYCEISLTAPSAANWTGAFTLDGTVVASGALVARDPRYDDAGDARIKRAADLREELVGHSRIIIRLAGGKAIAITADGTDYTGAVRDVTNPDYDLHALELGIGTNLALRPHVDWRLNSQLNEGAGPVHIGFGEGATGAHMDFIVADAEHSFEPTAA